MGELPFDSSRNAWEWNLSIDLSWNEIFYDVGPYLIDEISESGLHMSMNRMVRTRSRTVRSKQEGLRDHTNLRDFQIDDHDYQTIKIQLRALGLIAKSERARSLKDAGTYWTLTPYGDQVLTSLRAIRREDDSGDKESDDTEEQAREEP